MNVREMALLLSLSAMVACGGPMSEPDRPLPAQACDEAGNLELPSASEGTATHETGLRLQVQHLKGEMATLGRENDRLRDRASQLESETRKLREQIDTLRRQLESRPKRGDIEPLR